MVIIYKKNCFIIITTVKYRLPGSDFYDFTHLFYAIFLFQYVYSTVVFILYISVN